MKRLEWKILHDMDNEDGTHSCWSCEVNHAEYGKYLWITLYPDGYHVEKCNEFHEFETLKVYKNLPDAKAYVRKITRFGYGN